MRNRKSMLASAVFTLTLFGFQAQAQQGNYLDDRWEISGSYFRPDISLSGHANLVGTDGEDVVRFSDGAKVSGGVEGARFDISYRMTQRQSLTAGWYGVGRDRSWSISEQGTFTPDDLDADPVDYSIDGTARLDAGFELYRLSYGYDLVQSDNFTLTGLVGVYGAKLDVKGNTQGQGQVDGEEFQWSEASRWDRTRHAPGVGLAASFRPADRWDIRAQAQGFETSWGDFDMDGHFLHASAQIGYRFTPTWTAFAGYDWFKLKLEDEITGSASYDGEQYAVLGPASGTLKVHGPTLGLRAQF